MSAVFVAGRGAVSGYGLGCAALERGIASGERALRPRVRTRAHRGATAVAGEFPEEVLAALEVDASGDLVFRVSLAACREALLEAGVEPGGEAAARIGLVLASTKADLGGLPGYANAGDERPGLGLVSRLARRLADALGLRGVLAAVSTACASGVTALTVAQRRLVAGEEERVLVIGVDELSEFVMAGFSAMHILDPEACRPFDASRRGLSLGEAAGAMLLSAREADSLGVRLAGVGGANDGIHVTGCDREGEGVRLAAARALEDAGARPEDVDFVHLHGTGTRSNDASEAIGLGKLFDGPTPPAFGTKGQTGHTLGAGGLVESLIAVGALLSGRLSANVGLEEPGVDPRLTLLREPQALPAGPARVLKVSSGFGGIQQAVVFER